MNRAKQPGIRSLIQSLCVLALLAVCIGCAAGRPRQVSRDIPAGAVAITDEQKHLVDWARNLQSGVSKEQVQQRLGPPLEKTGDIWFYNLPENTLHGGQYVTATLSFERDTVAAVKIGYGHEERTPTSSR